MGAFTETWACFGYSRRPGLTLVAAVWVVWTGVGSGGPGPRRAWLPWAAGLAGATSGGNALLLVSKAAVGSGGTTEETVKVGGGGGGGKRRRPQLTVLFVLLTSRVVSVRGEAGSRGARLLLRHRDADLQRRRAVQRGPSQLDLHLDLGPRRLKLLLWGK